MVKYGTLVEGGWPQMRTISVTVVTNCVEIEGGCVDPTTNGPEPHPHAVDESLIESCVKV